MPAPWHRLMVFDEPTGNLDITNEDLIIREAVRISREKNVSILCSLHDLNQAVYMGDRFFFMKNGRILYDCRKEEITEEIIRDIYDTDVRIVETDGLKIFVKGKESSI